MNAPTLDEVMRELEELAGKDVDPKLNVKDLGIDSLVLAEWAFGLQERLNVFIEDERLQGLLDLPIEDIYRELVREAGLQPT